MKTKESRFTHLTEEFLKTHHFEQYFIDFVVRNNLTGLKLDCIDDVEVPLPCWRELQILLQERDKFEYDINGLLLYDGSLRYTYDEHNNMTECEYSHSGHTYTNTYKYEHSPSLGKFMKASRTFPGGSCSTYKYDDKGRETYFEYTDETGHKTFWNYTYTDNIRIEENESGYIIEKEYDLRGNLIHLKAPSMSYRQEYTFDKEDRLIKMVRIVGEDGTPSSSRVQTLKIPPHCFD